MSDDLDNLIELVSQNGKGQFIHSINDLKGEILGAKYLEQLQRPHKDYDALQGIYDELWNSFPGFHKDYENHLREMEESKRTLEG